MTLRPVDRRRTLAATAVLLGAVATAANPVFVRLADVELLASAFHRMVWAIPLIGLWTWTARRWQSPAQIEASAHAPHPQVVLSPPVRRDVPLLVACGAFFAADLASLHAAISLTHAANAILFLNAQPIYVVVAAWVLFGAVVSTRFIAAAAVAMAGAGLLVWQSASFGGDHLLGDGLGMLAGLCYAGYILAGARLRKVRSSAEINLWTCLVGAPILLLAALLVGQDVVPHSGRDWALMIALGVVCQACGQGLIVWGLAHLPPSFSSVALLVAPIAAALFARLFLDELLSGVQMLAMLIVLAGIYGAWRASFAIVEAPERPAG